MLKNCTVYVDDSLISSEDKKPHLLAWNMTRATDSEVPFPLIAAMQKITGFETFAFQNSGKFRKIPENSGKFRKKSGTIQTNPEKSGKFRFSGKIRKKQNFPDFPENS